jgi:hypothetical protein
VAEPAQGLLPFSPGEQQTSQGKIGAGVRGIDLQGAPVGGHGAFPFAGGGADLSQVEPADDEVRAEGERLEEVLLALDGPAVRDEEAAEVVFGLGPLGAGRKGEDLPQKGDRPRRVPLGGSGEGEPFEGLGMIRRPGEHLAECPLGVGGPAAPDLSLGEVEPRLDLRGAHLGELLFEIADRLVRGDRPHRGGRPVDLAQAAFRSAGAEEPETGQDGLGLM